jgi:HK97 family phage major capsid protein
VDAAKDEIMAKQAADAPRDGFVRSGDGIERRDGSLKEFETAGEFFQAVARSAIHPHAMDPRLKQRAVSGNSEGLAPEGGFAVTKPVQLAVTEELWNTGQILQRVNRIPVSGNGIKLVRVDETSRVDGSRGGAVTAEWTQEGGKPTAGKIKLREHNLDLKKLTALGYATEELLEDAPALEAEMVKAFRSELLFKAEDAVINGTGNGQPLGILNANALVTQAINGSQNIGNTPTYIAENLSAMLSRIPAPLWGNAVLIANPSHLPTFVTATVGDQRIYIPAGTAGMQMPTILGVPVIWSEYPAAKNAAGDLILAALNQYDVAEKSVGPQFATSAHLRFDYGEMTFRFTYRLDGQPGWRSAVTPYKGADSKSPFITLAARS